MLNRLVSARSLGLLLLLSISCSTRPEGAPSLASDQSAALVQAGIPRADAADRQLIRTVSLDMEVERLWSARQQAEALTREAGGFVESVDGSRAGSSQTLSLSLR